MWGMPYSVRVMCAEYPAPGSVVGVPVVVSAVGPVVEVVPAESSLLHAAMSSAAARTPVYRVWRIPAR